MADEEFRKANVNENTERMNWESNPGAKRGLTALRTAKFAGSLHSEILLTFWFEDRHFLLRFSTTSIVNCIKIVILKNAAPSALWLFYIDHCSMLLRQIDIPRFNIELRPMNCHPTSRCQPSLIRWPDRSIDRQMLTLPPVDLHFDSFYW